MNLGQQILFLVSALGACNGILLGIYLFRTKKQRSVAAVLLGILLLALSIRVGKSVLLFFNPQLSRIILQIGLTACFLIGPSLYYFLKSAITKPVKIPAMWKWVWGAQLGIILVAGFIAPYKVNPWIWNKVFVFIVYGQWAAYVVASGFLIRNYLKALFTDASALNNTEKLWLLVYLGNCVIFLGYLVSWIGIVNVIYMTGPISFSFMLYITMGFIMYGTSFENETPQDKPERKRIAEGSAQLWTEKLEKAVQENDLYKNPNLKLNDLAQQINISGHQLSQLLNDNLGKSFSTFINEYRINEACKLIESSRHLTFEAIGYDVGYNSKSTFYAAFRKIKGTTPALYKEQLEKITS
ncbi:AraC family transcriptional regulator [Chitinophaga lutea]|uniref:AraC family transcriptional regulator n=1 Tax=Chitinophaga lutea TaxID=2488634 RepID=A0A3N4Q0P7_9BACT|nr:helix-turn-helix domain-containing protein [Chitinophaga lutea]RPE12759.1 AraC family transcriptional regulator [Chitinophaga lutea]